MSVRHPKSSAGVGSDGRRDELAEKAAEIIAEKGYEGCGVQDLIRHLGLSKGGFYWHFQSKEDLYLQVCRLYCNKARQVFFDVLRSQGSGVEGLVAASKRLLEYFVSNPAHVRLLVGFHQEAKSESVRRELESLQEGWVRRMTEAIRQCNGAADTEGLARRCVVFFDGLLLRLSLTGSKDWVCQEWDDFLRGLLREG